MTVILADTEIEPVGPRTDVEENLTVPSSDLERIFLSIPSNLFSIRIWVRRLAV